MSRRKESLFEAIVPLPWWVGLIAAAVSYIFISTVIPPILSQSKLLAGVGPGLRQVALLAAGIFTLASALSALRVFFLAHKFDAQRGLTDLRTLRWSQFESIVGEAFRRQGYTVSDGVALGLTVE